MMRSRSSGSPEAAKVRNQPSTWSVAAWSPGSTVNGRGWPASFGVRAGGSGTPARVEARVGMADLEGDDARGAGRVPGNPRSMPESPARETCRPAGTSRRILGKRAQAGQTLRVCPPKTDHPYARIPPYASVRSGRAGPDHLAAVTQGGTEDGRCRGIGRSGGGRRRSALRAGDASAQDPVLDERLLDNPPPRSRARSSMSARRGQPAWLLYLLAAGATAVAYLETGSGGARLSLHDALPIATLVATVAGVVAHRPGRALPWWLLAAGLLSNVVGDVLLLSMGDPEAQLLPNVADVFYLACYPLFAGGLLMLARSRVPGRDRAGLIDALIMATGAALLAWTFLISPNLREPDLDLIARLVSVAYPLGDVLLLAVALRLAVGAGTRPTAYRLIGAAVIALLATDVCYVVLGL